MKKYVVKVTQETTLIIKANSEEEALDEAYETYLDEDADSVDACVISVEDCKRGKRSKA